MTRSDDIRKELLRSSRHLPTSHHSNATGGGIQQEIGGIAGRRSPGGIAGRRSPGGIAGRDRRAG
jgi:hypothetical protein